VLRRVRADVFVSKSVVVPIFVDAKQLAISIEHAAIFDCAVVYHFIFDFDVLDEQLVDAAE
jgi:hypothetical protein